MLIGGSQTAVVRVFVHAGIDPNCPLDEQDADNMIWKIYPDDDDGGHGRRHVIHGHHQHAHGPIFKKNRTNLDTLAWYTGRLSIGVFDDAAPGGPIEVLEVHGEPIEKILSSRRSMSSLATKRKLSSRAALLDNFETMGQGRFLPNARQWGPITSSNAAKRQN